MQARLAELLFCGECALAHTPNPLPLRRPEDSFKLPNLAISAAGFLKITLSRVTHNPKVAGSNPAPATISLILPNRFDFPALINWVQNSQAGPTVSIARGTAQ